MFYFDGAMDVFDLRDHLIGDYATYISSFIQIRDRRIRDYVHQELQRGLLWPEQGFRAMSRQ